MAKALIRMHVLREIAAVYEQWRRHYPNDAEEGDLPVPVTLLRMAHEIIEENDKRRM